MTLDPETRLGPYKIEASIGAGGMGEVYRAVDTRLDRVVAIKVLPSHLSAHPDFRARFEREAKTISSLQHPHVCALFDVGQENGVDFLVMEYLEGMTLTQKLAEGPLPFEEVLRNGIQIAEALDAAHRQGIVHRDLKPANVMITRSGVKLLDFGLAKVAELVAPPNSGIMTTGAHTAALGNRPASSSLTAEGAIVGTFQYMAPEQLEGAEADSRTDIFALGAVLYEMATGRKAFDGKSQASLIASIMSSKPASISSVQPMAPPALDRIIRICLEKERDDRWQAARDLARELQWVSEGGSDVAMPRQVGARRRSRERLAWGLAAVAGIAALGLGYVQFTRPEPPRPQPMRFEVSLPGVLASIESPKISPDGSMIAYPGTDSLGATQLWLRPLNSIEAHPIPGTEGAGRPFWSPDSRNLGFFSDGKLQRVSVEGGMPLTLCEFSRGADGVWGDGMILFDGRGGDSIQVVSAGGGAIGPATRIDRSIGETGHGWPFFLPDGQRFLFLTFRRDDQPSELRLGRLGSFETELLLEADSRLELAPGYLIYEKDGSLLGRPFDGDAGRITGDPFPLAEGIGTGTVGLADFSTSANGILIYRGGGGSRTQLMWVDRRGQTIEYVGQAEILGEPQLSPNRTRLAVSLEESNNWDVWVIDPENKRRSRLTFAKEDDYAPLWSPDGSQIYFSSDRNDGLFVKNASGTDADRLVRETPGHFMAFSIIADGSVVLGGMVNSQGDRDVVSFATSGEGEITTIVGTPAIETHASLSPNGKFIAYTSNESGQREVYLTTYPSGNGRWQVSRNGGQEPTWRGDGGEIFYMGADNRIMAVDASLEDEVLLGQPVPLFFSRLGAYDGERNRFVASPDGQRFLLAAPPSGLRLEPINVMINWTEDLKQR